MASSLDRKEGEGTKAAFLRWCDSYLLASKALPCNSLELYGARCGVLHAGSPDSDLSRLGKAR